MSILENTCLTTVNVYGTVYDMRHSKDILVALDGGYDGEAWDDDDNGSGSAEWQTGYMIHDEPDGVFLYHGDPLLGNGDLVASQTHEHGAWASIAAAKAGAQEHLESTGGGGPLTWQTFAEAYGPDAGAR